jgi:hypothetical protein
VRWRNPHPWGESDYLRRSLPQKDKKVVTLYTYPPLNSTIICLDELWGR